jgi:hypothetical protein
MSKVKIQGNASGSGVLTVTAPNTSTDRTITLPDATGTLLTADGDGSSLTGISHTDATKLPLAGGTLTGDVNILKTSGNSLFKVEASGTDAYASVGIENDAKDYSMQIRSDQGDAWTVRDETAGANRLLISSNGEVTMPNQPCFSSHNNANDSAVTGDGTVITAEFDVESFDQNADFDTSTDIFTAPVTGRYLLTSQVTLGNIGSGHTLLQFYIVTSNRTYYTHYNPYVSWPTTTVRNLTVIADMDASDTAYVSLAVTGSTKTVSNLAEATQWLSWFSGALIA